MRSSTPQQEPFLYAGLKELIDSPVNQEIPCRAFLRYVPEFLCRDTVIDYVYKEEEYRGNTGDSDYIISGRIRDFASIECIRAYVWEIKAPQCYIFEKDTENRLKPSRDLIQAENQLLHYFHENKGSELFRETFKVTHSDNVKFGGIIIGCNKNRIRGEFRDAEKANLLFQKALHIRSHYFYDSFGIRLMTWDTILDSLNSEKFINKKSDNPKNHVYDAFLSTKDGIILFGFKSR